MNSSNIAEIFQINLQISDNQIESHRIMTDTTEKCDEQQQRIPVYLPRFLKPRPPNDSATPTAAHTNERLGIELLFPGICMHFLHDECVEMNRCIRLHELPSAEQVYMRLCEHDAGQMAKLFNVIIVRCAKLLHIYFKTFLDFFAMHWQRDDLIKAIGVCERTTNDDVRGHQFQTLVLAFMLSGMSYEATMQTILAHLTSKTSRSINFVLTASIVEQASNDSVARIVSMLVRKKTLIEPATIDRLMTMFLDTHNNQLANCIVHALEVQHWVRAQLNRTLFERFMHAYSSYASK